MLHVLSPGPLATLQDTGRWGAQALGIGTAGAMDVFAARVANALLGNERNAAVLEITAGAARFVVERAGVFVVTGADLDAHLDDRPLGVCEPFLAEPGQLIRFGRSRSGWRACLAISGGFVAESAFGSTATDVRAGIGGLHGRALARNDRIDYAIERQPERIPRGISTVLANPCHRDDAPLGLIVSSMFHAWPVAVRESLLAQAFRVTQESDRMGLRLEPAVPGADALPQQLTAAVCFGAVQLPPDGKAIILGADRQTTGGYPLAGVVAGVDHWRLAQARPGEALAFRAVSADEAARAWCEREQRINRLELAASAAWRKH